MPRIYLKPNSPEFASEPAEKPRPRCCDMPGCREDSAFRAPKDRSLRDYYWFCLDHVREYNKAWDFFSGMAPTEVEEYHVRSQYGDRPTWRYDMEGAAESLHRAARNFRSFREEDDPSSRRKFSPQEGQTPEVEALSILRLSPPVTLEAIKTRYKELVKKHHPDLNPDCKVSEELLKSINMAYTILKMAYGKFETYSQE